MKCFLIKVCSYTLLVRLFNSVLLRCRFVYWLQNVFRSLSSFIACTISLDRMCRACYPIRAKHFCTARLATQIVLVYILVFMISYSFYLLPYMGEDSSGVCSTSTNPIYHKFMTSIWPPMRTCLVCILPVSVMIITNTRLWRRVRASKRRVTPRMTNMSHSANTEIMLMFIAVSNVLAFLITQIPFHIYTTVVRYKKSIDHIRTLMLLWSSLYFGVGFYIYSLISPYFRSKFIATVNDCFKKKGSIDNVQRTTISQHVPH